MGRKELKVLVLNIAMDLDRVGRFAMENKEDRRKQFLELVNKQVKELENVDLPITFLNTYEYLRENLKQLNMDAVDASYIDNAFTTASMLTNRGVRAIDIITMMKDYQARE
ncbi:hypothetical protein COZ14_00860 [Candidatus Dojkabacteria bacterium CG_4_10_14_3_um_filter_Dojkabacteria_WS6_41_9]|uniref:Uncharacterized protein n=1 Tax=Candidatus Dojkabacteria bacterium CG_4_10_14_0_2_um_filter_Dojkabacteria_WS6_41_15 TaxID=2014249 RepID=A0A2M7W1W7_9BACT|nr:MAG: hypothetical protein COZ14_00860 [Candidatus Dojkabacteria bacterium CG_4_10_14_3_um_filter_Dojkabacteria_WS6_41_9]PJA13914.1 MAG: hypothetical protein COX64_02640 [Candidatus Dojkabacteria bacterium CG_4_10_14_0_2_um_filter_Dojkabacteria_WS6_41_15]